MPGLLGFTSFGVSAGLFIYGAQSDIIPEGLRFIILLVLMAAGTGIAYMGLQKAKTRSEDDIIKIVSKAIERTGTEKE